MMLTPSKKGAHRYRKLFLLLAWLALCGVLCAYMLPTPAVYGGCPWNKISEITVSPPTPCLELSARQGAGGCVNPELDGQNNCPETLLIWIGKTPSHSERIYQFAPGAGISVVVDMAVSTPYRDNSQTYADRYEFQLPAKIGERDISITFHTLLEIPFSPAEIPMVLLVLLSAFGVPCTGGLILLVGLIVLPVLFLFRGRRQQ